MPRAILSYHKVQTAIGYLKRNRRWFADLKQPGCYIDLGCGPNIDPTWCNVDYSWQPGINVVWDLTKELPFPDRYAAGIFTEHMLEHIPFDAALRLLTECRRVLRDGSTLRVVMPDGGLYLRRYVSGDSIPYADGDAKAYPFVTPLVSVNRIFREHGHRFIWDFDTLKAALMLAGFKQVQACQFGQGRDSKLLRDTPFRKVESFYVEAY